MKPPHSARKPPAILPFSHRGWLLTLGLLIVVSGWGCRPAEPGKSPPELIVGRHGYSAGRFHKPRAIAISDADELFV
ncbi:MAG: hypothetical protein ACKOUR_13830, partial [Planctomycetota bacterium]